MTTAKVKRSQVAHFLNTGTTGSPTWSSIGEGVTSATINYNPQTVEEIYITEDSGTTEVESYKPTMPVEATALNGDAVFEYIDTKRKARSVLDDAHSELLNVWEYETPSGSPAAYPAEKQDVSIQIDDFGGEGGKAAKINFTLNFLGNPTSGSFVPTTGSFTAS